FCAGPGSGSGLRVRRCGRPSGAPFYSSSASSRRVFRCSDTPSSTTSFAVDFLGELGGITVSEIGSVEPAVQVVGAVEDGPPVLVGRVGQAGGDLPVGVGQDHETPVTATVELAGVGEVLLVQLSDVVGGDPLGAVAVAEHLCCHGAMRDAAIMLGT